MYWSSWDFFLVAKIEYNESTWCLLFYQVENSNQPMQGNLIVLDSQFCAMANAFWILCQWNLDSNYKWDPEYLALFPDSKRTISQIPDSLTWGDSYPKITFFVKPKLVNWTSNYCRLRVHVVLVTTYCSCHYMLEKGVCGPGEIVAGIVVFQNQMGMIMKQLIYRFSHG